MFRSNPWITAAVVAVASMSSSAARADAKNEVRAVTFDEDGGVTRIHVRGAQTPTFTVYKLERPSRVVIDLPQAKLAEVLRGHESATTLSSNTWAVSTIAAQQLDDGGAVVRIIITLARPGSYDVKTEGNEVVVMVTARDAAPKTASPEALAAAQAQAAQAEAAAKKSHDEADVAKKQALAAQAEAERLRKAAEQAQRAADDTKKQTSQSSQSNQAEIDRAKADAARAQAEAAKAKQAASAAQLEADRTRDAAERARVAAVAEADRARLETAKSKAEADAAKSQAAQAQSQAAQAQSQAAQAQSQAAKAQSQATQAQTQAAQAKTDAARAQTEAAQAQAEADAAKTETARARTETEVARTDAERAKSDAERARTETERAKGDAVRAKDQVAAAQRQASAAEQAAARTKAEADKAKADAARAHAEADKIKDDAAKSRAEIDRAKADAVRAQDEAEKKVADAERARGAAEAATRAKDEANAQQAEAAKRQAMLARQEADAAKAEIAAAHKEAELAKADAAKARGEAETARAAAAADKHAAEQDKQKAEQMMRDARTQLGSLDQKMAAAQALEDKARATSAAAQAREEAARETAERAQRERVAAEDAAKKAAAARDRSSSQAQSERDRLSAEAKAAEDRLAAANKATQDAEARRTSAETAANGARKDLEQTRSSLATVEQQRDTAERAASEAAQKKSDAEVAARQAASRRDEAETAANQAAKKRDEAVAAATTASQKRGEAEAQRVVAEQQRKAAEEATKAAQAAKEAAERQRSIAETAAAKSEAARQKSEDGLAELGTRRDRAEKAAAELEARSKAAAKAQAEVAAVEARKAGEVEIGKAKAEAARLADDRKKAETDLADRRKAVALQQAEAERLKVAATDARDAADREETRRAQLAQQRADEEKALDRVKKQREEAVRVAATEKAVKIAPAPTPTTPAPTAKPAHRGNVDAIDFKGDEAGARVSLAVSGDVHVQLGESSSSMVELVIDNADLASKLEKKLEVSRYNSAVRSVSSFKDRHNPNRVRLIAELTQPVTPSIEKGTDGAVRWMLTPVGPTGGGAPAKTASNTPTPTPTKTRTQDVGATVVGGFGATSTPVAQQSVGQLPPQGGRRRIYHGATVDFDFKDAPIHDLLRIIADTGHISIVVPDSITAKVTVRLKRVPWDQALEVILASYGLWYRRDGNLYRIAPRKELDTEDEAEAARRAAQIQAEVPRPEVVTLNYASATELKSKFEGMLSPKGHIEVEERTNALIINDVAGNREQIIRLALQLDTQTPQISIEARIVEANSDFKRQIGVQWGGRALSGAQWGNATGLLFPSSVTIAGANEDAQTNSTGVASPSDFAVNIPAATGTGEGGALGLSLGSIAGTFDINLRLSALEDTSTVRIISAPKITVLNNNEAKISQGVSIPISVVSAAGTQTQFVQADLSLTVTPYVSQRDCAIAMKLVVTKNEPDFQQTGARGDPTILRKEAKTSMLVNDGETAVLGGIYTRNSGLQYKKVPWFADLPVIGYLFKNRSENDDRTEVLVFITPKITNKASLRCQ